MNAPAKLPNRRASFTKDVNVGGRIILLTVGMDLKSRRVLEVFADGEKPGSGMEEVLDDCCILASHALQAGHTAAELARQLGAEAKGIDGAAPASTVARLLQCAAEIERDIAAELAGAGAMG